MSAWHDNCYCDRIEDIDVLIKKLLKEETMTEEEKFYVHKYSGHYYTENRIPASGKVLFEGTEMDVFLLFVEKFTIRQMMV